MSRNGSGTYNLPAGNPVVTGTTISSTWANNTLSDIANALTGSVAADGQTPMTGNLDLNSNKIVNLAAGTVAGNAVEYAQFVAATVSAVHITGGTIDGTDIGQTTAAKGKFTDLEASGTVKFTGTGAAAMPKGTTAQQPIVPIDGMIRYNTDTLQFEGYINGSWQQVGGGATGGGGDTVFVENSLIVTTSYTFPTGKNASSVGPITVNSGVSVTIPTSQRWVIL